MQWPADWQVRLAESVGFHSVSHHYPFCVRLFCLCRSETCCVTKEKPLESQNLALCGKPFDLGRRVGVGSPSRLRPLAPGQMRLA